MKIVERTRGYYETEDMGLGRVYRWCPECVVIECDCGARQTLTGFMATCRECGADYASAVREELAAMRLEDDKFAHPWRYEAMDREEAGIPY